MTVTNKKHLTNEDRKRLKSLFEKLNEAYILSDERGRGRIEGKIEEIRNQATKRTA